MRKIDELIYLMALPLVPEVGLQRAKQIISFFGSAGQFFMADKEALQQIPNVSSFAVGAILGGRQSALDRAEREAEFIQKHGIKVSYIDDETYPERLRQCHDAPLLLYGKGNIDANTKHVVSVVGTRMPTPAGRERCRQLVLDLAKQVPDLTIVSGLAYGIDVTAHKAAIEAGVPTIIIPGHGLDRIYPAVHRQVAVNSLENGGMLTEYMSGTTPDRQNFVARNRIIAGMADAVVVVESKEKGGSLITAEMAWTDDRDLFAFPGRPEDECAKGCNRLIKQQKAALIESGEDLIKTMGWDIKPQQHNTQTSLFDDLTSDEQALVDMLREAEDGIHINQITQTMKMAFGTLTALLFNLELRGYVKSLPGGMYRAVIRT